jgi:hypothetical protein
MNADNVAMPTPMTVAVRIPATIIGKASGISTMKSLCCCVNPRPWAASITSGETSHSPVYVFRTMGRTA